MFPCKIGGKYTQTLRILIDSNMPPYIYNKQKQGTVSRLIEILALITIYDRPRSGMIASINFKRLPAASI